MSTIEQLISEIMDGTTCSRNRTRNVHPARTPVVDSAGVPIFRHLRGSIRRAVGLCLADRVVPVGHFFTANSGWNRGNENFFLQ